MKPMAQKDNCSLFTQADNEVLMASDIKRSSGLLSDAARRRHEGKQRRGFHLEETTAEKHNFSSVPSLPAELTGKQRFGLDFTLTQKMLLQVV